MYALELLEISVYEREINVRLFGYTEARARKVWLSSRWETMHGYVLSPSHILA